MHRHRYQSFLTDLLAHWQGTHTADATFSLPTPEESEAFFWIYRRALGEDPVPRPGRGQILAFTAGYLHLRRGEREQAGQHFDLLTSLAPRFADAWVWRTVATDDPARRQEYLKTALRAEPGHPLARDALAIARGELPIPDRKTEEQVTLAKCPQCGGSLPREPGTVAVVCPYCGAEGGPRPADLPGGEAGLDSQPRLQRLHPPQTWEAAQRIVYCQACGAEMTVPEQPVARCAFCGSTDLSVQDAQRVLEQPDGFLPFELDRQRALDAIGALQKSGVRGLRRWWGAWASQELGCRTFPVGLTGTLRNLKLWWAGRKFQVSSIAAAYLPFWAFDGVVQVRRPSEDGLTPPQIAEERGFEHVLFPGVEIPESWLLERLYPFDLAALRPYEPSSVADPPARLYNLDAGAGADRARSLMLGLARLRTDLQSKATAKTAVISGHAGPGRPPTFQVGDITYRLVLLPVWAARLERQDRHLLALVNGQTGRVTFGPAVPGGSS